MSAADDYRFMSEALRLAARGLYSTRPNPRVGCVVVQDGRIVGRGYHHHAGGPHAETEALREAGLSARGACVYVTLEPCCHHGRTPPCVEALIAAGVGHVVFATSDPHPLVDGGGARRLADAGIGTTAGVLEREALALNGGFFKRLKSGQPWVRVKTAMSLDAKVALASGESKWITGPAARGDVQRLRAMSCAVMTGSGTVLADDPALSVRDPRFDTGGRQPTRVVLDGALRIPLDRRILEPAGEVWVFTASDDAGAIARFERAGARVEHVASVGRGLDLLAVLQRLADLEINEVLVEAGPTLTGSFIEAGLIDELVIYIAPSLLGTDARGAFDFASPAALRDVPGFTVKDVTRVGTDWRVIATPV